MTELGIIELLQTVTQHPIGRVLAIFAARWLIFVLGALVIFFTFRSASYLLKHAAREAAWATPLAIIASLLLDRVFERTRPFVASANIHLLVPTPLSQFSFPSTHTAAAFAMAIGLLSGNTRIGLWAVVLALLVGLGRVLVGVHYPTDILAGAVVGALAFSFVRYLHYVLRRMTNPLP
jgi:undecaprenyl-diphosphatase